MCSLRHTCNKPLVSCHTHNNCPLQWVTKGNFNGKKVRIQRPRGYNNTVIQPCEYKDTLLHTHTHTHTHRHTHTDTHLARTTTVFLPFTNTRGHTHSPLELSQHGHNGMLLRVFPTHSEGLRSSSSQSTKALPGLQRVKAPLL